MSTCETRFYICRHCGNVIGLITSSGVPVVCCGEEMEQLVPNTTDASQEKHLPIVSVNGNTVKVDIGFLPHPMTEQHSIEWVYLMTDKGGQRKCFAAGSEPGATFALSGDKPEAVFAYCNLHGLWMTKI